MASKLKLILSAVGAALLILGLGLAVLLTSNGNPAVQPTETSNLESAKPTPEAVAPLSPTANSPAVQALLPTITPSSTEPSTVLPSATPSTNSSSSTIQTTSEPDVAPTQEVARTVERSTATPLPPAKSTAAKTSAQATSPVIDSTPIIATITVPAPPANSSQSWRGPITTISSSNLSLSNHSDPILLTSATRITLAGVKIPITALKIGQEVTVQLIRNSQGQFVAQLILASPLPPPKAGPPK